MRIRLVVNRRMTWTSAALGALLVPQMLGGCNFMPDPSEIESESATAMISAAVGGTVAGANGLALEIPPGALAQDTQITVTSFSTARLAELDPAAIAGAILEPEGLTFSQPATLRVPLPEPWPFDDPPMELEFRGSDPAQAVQSGLLAGLSEDRMTAIFEVRHFSGKICANQCHAGVREWLTARFAERGCAMNDWKKRVHGKFPDVELREDCQFISPSEISAILDTFFEDHGGWAADESVPADDLARLQSYAEAGREVVFAFWPKDSGPRQAPYSFYRGLAHTAVAERRSGTWQIRNTLRVPNDKATVLQFLDGTNLVWWPLADLNGFRAAKQGVPVEVQFCGAAGCLDSNELNPYPPLAERLVPWQGVRVWVERLENVPCQRLAGCWEFDVTSDGTTTTLLLRFDDLGEVDSLWFKFSAGENAGQFGEFVRFARPNAAIVAPALTDVAHDVTQTADQSQFDASMQWSFLEDDGNNGTRLSLDVLIRLTGARMSINTPDETFEALYEQGAISYSYDEEGNRTSTNSTISTAIVARRVPCPDPAAGTGVAQEQVFANFGSGDGDGDLCGTGAAAAMPLMVLGLTASRLRLCRRRRRHWGSAAKAAWGARDR